MELGGLSALPWLLLIGAAVLLAFSWILRRLSRLPRGRVIALDAAELSTTGRTLFDAQLQLAGRPDFLLAQGNSVVPVEVKSGMAPQQPYEGHVLQLAAYCRLVEAEYGMRPEYGVVRYHDRSFSVPFSRGLERQLLAALDEMRRSASLPPRSHDAPGRCGACGFRAVCDQSLAG